jgi:hypothetical protein
LTSSASSACSSCARSNASSGSCPSAEPSRTRRARSRSTSRDEVAECDRDRAVSACRAEVGPHVVADLHPRLVISHGRWRPGTGPASASSSHAPQSMKSPKTPRARTHVEAASVCRSWRWGSPEP